jgi:D-arabinose 1-dehydrogenase-like Zn-dependent alcohol dehydrogenase
VLKWSSATSPNWQGEVRVRIEACGGASMDSQGTLAFSALSGVRPMIERMPLSRAPQAYAKIMKGDARFRMVLTMAQEAA